MTASPRSDALPLRVAQVGGYASDTADGVQKTILGLLGHLPQHGIEVELWSCSPQYGEPRLSRVDEVPVLELPSRRRPASLLAPLPRMTREAIRDRAREVHLVHFHSVFLPENVWTARLLEVPYLITPHGGYGPKVLRGRNRLAKTAWLFAFERGYLRSAAALHAVSPSEAEDIAVLVDPSKIVTVPNAVDDECLRRDVGAPRGRDLLFLGRLAVEHKGLDLLLRGFARSSALHGSRLIIAGPDFREGREGCERLARELGISGSVSFPGPVFGDGKWAIIDACYAFVHTSRWEGLPHAVLEALALGKPALVTRETNLADLVAERRAGIVVEANPDSISRGIQQLLAVSGDEYESMSRRARQLVQDHFTWQLAAVAMANEYRRVASADARA
jgi:glycosyltransferase involved in cell wall biosynthesis